MFKNRYNAICIMVLATIFGPICRSFVANVSRFCSLSLVSKRWSVTGRICWFRITSWIICFVRQKCQMVKDFSKHTELNDIVILKPIEFDSCWIDNNDKHIQILRGTCVRMFTIGVCRRLFLNNDGHFSNRNGKQLTFHNAVAGVTIPKIGS